MRTTALRWAGTRTLLVEVGTLEDVVALHRRLTDAPLPGQIEVLAAASTVMLAFDTRAHALAAPAALDRLDDGPSTTVGGREITVDVVYDGDDLAEVARMTGLGADGVIAAHTAQLWTAAFGGFAPGFAYLHGDDASLEVPRRQSPRTAVPAGSVAVAGRFSAIYPARSPGGWQLIGRTQAVMWDLDRDPPALVRPGDRVRYRAVRELVELHPTAGTPTPRAEDTGGAEASDTSLLVLSPGPQSLIQDLGRPGLGDLGVPAAGAADTASARQANRLVGNPAHAAVVETLVGGLRIQACGELTLSLTGAAETATVSGPHGRRPVAARAPFALHDHEVLTVQAPTSGLRSYLAVRGGLVAEAVLGSRSADTLSGLGPAPLVSGTSVPVASVARGHIVTHPEPSVLPRPREGTVNLRITSGPRADWFAPDAIDALCRHPWSAGSQSNRVGLRLETGDRQTPVERIRTGELSSEGTATGSLQVPPSGLPVLFLTDHPVTGGYPVIAVVVPEDLPAAAQVPPGTSIRFTVVDPDTLLPRPPARSREP
ncbi:carboxyltransferase domain-containing protein [Arthrobacter sp. 179]|uniref:carboxyltransferase domain-containing protein n=1 Tax=Arthrobacter sp. 179 TaxID=3457734 RepID=UPI0040332D37